MKQITILIILFIANSANAQWQVSSQGMFKGKVFTPCVSGKNIIVRTMQYHSPIEHYNNPRTYYSKDYGSTWKEIENVFGDLGVGRIIKVDTFLFAMNSSGIYTSSDDGLHWSKHKTESSQYDMAIYAAHHSKLFAFDDYGNFYKSTDNGVSWIDSTSVCPGFWVNCILFRNGQIFIGTEGDGVYVSYNEGESWARADTGMIDKHVRTMVLSGDKIIAGTAGSSYRHVYWTNPNGTIWVDYTAPLFDHNINTFAWSGENLYAGTDKAGIFVSENQGKTWKSINTELSNYNVKSLIVMDSILFAAIDTMCLIKINPDYSWSRVDNGMYSYDIKKLAGSDTHILAGGSNGYAYLSYNNLIAWKTLPLYTTYSFPNLFIDGNLIGEVFFYYYMNFSADLGETWYTPTYDEPIQGINNIIKVDNQLIASSWVEGLHSSLDSGKTWHKVNINLADTSIAPLINIGNKIYFGSYKGTVHITDPKLQNCEQIGYGLPNIGIKFLAATNSMIYAVNYNNQFYRSNGDYAPWQEITSFNFSGNITGIICYNNSLFVSTDTSGIFLSTDNGSTWKEKNNGLFTTHVLSMAISGNYLFAGTSGKGGIFKAPLDALLTYVSREDKIKNTFTVYPNPGSGSFTIESNGSLVSAEIKIFNILGNIVWNGVSTGDRTQVNISSFPTGMYFVQVGDETQLIIKQ